jgi:hypothetical protein
LTCRIVLSVSRHDHQIGSNAAHETVSVPTGVIVVAQPGPARHMSLFARHTELAAEEAAHVIGRTSDRYTLLLGEKDATPIINELYEVAPPMREL